MKDLKGVGVALITPFKENGEIDFPALERVTEHVISGGVDYIVVLGTTGEPATMTCDEKRSVVECVIAKNNGRKGIVVGYGGNNTANVVADIRSASFDGVDYILSVTPYYNKPNQRGIYQHYKAVAEASPVPVILYNVPGRTGINMSADTTLKIAKEVKNIAAVKEASGNIGQMVSIVKDRPEGFLVISGDDNLALPLIALGGDGVISVSANAFPENVSKLVSSALSEDFEAARNEHYKLCDITNALFEDGNPAGVKAALKIKGIIDDNLRLPLVSACESVKEKIAADIKKYSL